METQKIAKTSKLSEGNHPELAIRMKRRRSHRTSLNMQKPPRRGSNSRTMKGHTRFVLEDPKHQTFKYRGESTSQTGEETW